jgi:hypothetical protein
MLITVWSDHLASDMLVNSLQSQIAEMKMQLQTQPKDIVNDHQKQPDLNARNRELLTSNHTESPAKVEHLWTHTDRQTHVTAIVFFVFFCCFFIR